MIVMEKENLDPNKFFAPIRELMLDLVEKGEGKIGSIHFRQIDNLWEDRMLRKR
jgi:hypothetical protein